MSFPQMIFSGVTNMLALLCCLVSFVLRRNQCVVLCVVLFINAYLIPTFWSWISCERWFQNSFSLNRLIIPDISSQKWCVTTHLFWIYNLGAWSPLSHEKICWRSICIQFFLSWAFVSLAVQIYFTFNTSLISKIFDNDLLKVIALKNARIVTGIGSSKLVSNHYQQ